MSHKGSSFEECACFSISAEADDYCARIMAPVTLGDLAPLPVNDFWAAAAGAQRVGRWASFDSMAPPSRMGSIDVSTPAMLFPGTPTPHASQNGPPRFGLEPEQASQLQNGLMESCQMSAMSSVSSMPSTSAPSKSSSASDLPCVTGTGFPDGQHASARQSVLSPVIGGVVPDAALLQSGYVAGLAAAPLPNAFHPVQLPEMNTLAQGYMATFPSAGSALHNMGRCSPCAWFWKSKGCRSGTECTFCHLCPQDELKRRKRAKLEAIRNGALEPVARQVSDGAWPEERVQPTLKLSNILL
eukprot:TRINITY_DN30388_c0_g1_i1.p1 TRINITY_DN30388_c0_g1~~TRINITY_DN30388_c0_g1_i1.p1  ORF type:complete len:299 (-),score=36.58 TRINITY_DN30388_c0_g1_i1:464-1360(-)